MVHMTRSTDCDRESTDAPRRGLEWETMGGAGAYFVLGQYQSTSIPSL